MTTLITPERAAELLALLPARINLNEPVKVRLSDVGMSRLYDYYADLREQAPVAAHHYLQPRHADEDGLRQYQLHELMHIFGPACGLGRAFPFTDGDVYLPGAETHADALRTIQYLYGLLERHGITVQERES